MFLFCFYGHVQFQQIGPTVIESLGEVSQKSYSSYIFNGDPTNHLNFKNIIYTFFDSQIDMNLENYNPQVDLTESKTYFIYKTTSVLNQNFIFNENSDPTNNPLICNHDSDIVAIVTYSISGQSKSIYMYNNLVLV